MLGIVPYGPSVPDGAHRRRHGQERNHRRRAPPLHRPDRRPDRHGARRRGPVHPGPRPRQDGLVRDGRAVLMDRRNGGATPAGEWPMRGRSPARRASSIGSRARAPPAPAAGPARPPWRPCSPPSPCLAVPNPARDPSPARRFALARQAGRRGRHAPGPGRCAWRCDRPGDLERRSHARRPSLAPSWAAPASIGPRRAPAAVDGKAPDLNAGEPG